MSQAFKKIVRIGTAKTYRGRAYSIYCKIEFSDDGRLSICGVEGPTVSGNAIGGCGQINRRLAQHVTAINCAPGWTYGKIREFLAVWDKWHLNDMKAGTPAQEAHIEKVRDQLPGYPKSLYEWACEELDKVGLLTDNGYKYGSGWLKVEVPAEVIEFLKGLPDTDKQPAWC